MLENRRLMTVTISKTVDVNVLKQSKIVSVHLHSVNVCPRCQEMKQGK